MLRWQLPVASPVPSSALLRLPVILASARDHRPNLAVTLRNRFAAAGCALTSSGTHALQMALDVVRSQRPGLPVLLPAYSCYEVATAAIGADMPIRLYDVDPATLEPDWSSVRGAASQGAAALVVAPLYGLPLDWATARAVSDELACPLIEDAAQAHGSFWEGAPVGSFGDFSVLSFGRGKGWTGGGGGALLWRGGAAPPHSDAAASAEIVPAVRAAAQWVFGRPSFYGIPASIPFLRLGVTIYHPPTQIAGMTNTSAFLVLASEAEAAVEVLHRRDTAAWYSHVLVAGTGSETVLPGVRMDGESGALRYPVRALGGWPALRGTAAVKLGAGPPYPTTLQALPAVARRLTGRAPNTPGADTVVRELVTLPTHARVTEEERCRLITLVGPRVVRS